MEIILTMSEDMFGVLAIQVGILILILFMITGISKKLRRLEKDIRINKMGDDGR